MTTPLIHSLGEFLDIGIGQAFVLAHGNCQRSQNLKTLQRRRFDQSCTSTRGQRTMITENRMGYYKERKQKKKLVFHILPMDC